MTSEDPAKWLSNVTDAEAAEWILGTRPVRPAVSEIASRVVGIVGGRQPVATAHLWDSMDDVVRAEIKSAIESALRKARRIIEEEDGR